ncbi:hypothetical protein RRG08_022092 [Elysia crispata]|uniref:Uncharacterized protein n=1 Tax=Elysia crispata TaxID=231223 RepID=A0AAE0Y2N1_9GAST|nr:hypothetical protein RRG08_022092 [Elysia crispata]
MTVLSIGIALLEGGVVADQTQHTWTTSDQTGQEAQQLSFPTEPKQRQTERKNQAGSASSNRANGQGPESGSTQADWDLTDDAG